ncbi:MAG TPA: redoxin domain-containing protein [Ktedonobacterales bacterium]|nr:redoxin domain-containing protein [Ktedonobacterales bacterium]
MKLRPGQLAPSFAMRDMSGRAVSLADYRGASVLISFNRAAVCPLCNVRTYHLIRRYPLYQQMGLNMIAFFESAPEQAHFYLDRLQAPYPIVADQRHEVYDAYGLGASFIGGLRALLGRRGVYREADRLRLGSGSNLWENLRRMDGKLSRLPGDFLIGPDGRVQVAHYGRDAGDFLMFRDLESAAFGAPLDERALAQSPGPRFIQR